PHNTTALSNQPVARNVSVRKLGLYLATTAALASLGLALPPEPAYAGGGVDITGWCRDHYGAPGRDHTPWHGVVVSNNVFGWRCQYGTDTAARFDVDMNA